VGGAVVPVLAGSDLAFAGGRTGAVATSFAAAEFSVATELAFGELTTARTRSCPFTGWDAPPGGKLCTGVGGAEGEIGGGGAVDFFFGIDFCAADVLEVDSSVAPPPITICATWSLRISA
jgi:hypothetical protein